MKIALVSFLTFILAALGHASTVQPLVAVASYDPGSYDTVNEVNYVRALLKHFGIDTTTPRWIYVRPDQAPQARKILATAIARHHLHVTLVPEKVQPAEPAAISSSESNARDDRCAETPLQEIDSCISSLSERIATMKADLTVLNERLKRVRAEPDKRPKLPAGSFYMCPERSVEKASAAVLRKKLDLEQAQKYLVALKRDRDQVAAERK